jgi:hypothetical protein
MAMKYDDTYIVKRILLKCDEVITEYTYRDEVITDTEAYFLAVELRDWIHEFKKKGLQEKLAELYEMAKKIDPDTASVISMAEDTLRKSK